jgi:hypothetical protein
MPIAGPSDEGRGNPRVGSYQIEVREFQNAPSLFLYNCLSPDMVYRTTGSRLLSGWIVGFYRCCFGWCGIIFDDS